MSGPLKQAGLERYCLLDIHRFDKGDFAQTMMGHMNARIL